VRQSGTGASGFTLIEAMLASVVLTVGILGLLGLQTVSLSRNVISNDISRVTNLGSDIIERIQFNRKKASEYNGINVTTSANCPTSGMGTMSLGDCNQWRQLLLTSGLSNVSGQVTATPVTSLTPSLNQTLVTVTFSWTEAARGGNVTGGDKTVQMNAVIAPE
jgi:type IV pilus assembly protein PilV